MMRTTLYAFLGGMLAVVLTWVAVAASQAEIDFDIGLLILWGAFVVGAVAGGVLGFRRGRKLTPTA